MKLLFLLLLAFSLSVKSDDDSQLTEALTRLYNNELEKDTLGLYLNCQQGPFDNEISVKCRLETTDETTQSYPVCRTVSVGSKRSYSDCTHQQFDSLTEFNSFCIHGEPYQGVSACHCLAHNCNGQ